MRSMVLKRVLIGLTCLSMMSFCILSAQAAGNESVDHVHVFKATGEEFPKVTNTYNEGTHTVIVMMTYECAGCGKQMDMEDHREEQAHSPRFSSMGDNHESPGAHYFKGVCECGFTTMVTIYCPGGNNHVPTP